MKYTKYSFLILILIGLFVSFSFVLAEGEEDKCKCRSGTYRYDVYACVGNCPGKIEKRSYTGCWSSCCDGNPCRNYPKLNSTSIVAEGGSWQACKSGTYTYCHKYCSTSPDSYKPYFVCDGSCLANVNNVRYYSNPNYPQKPELTIDESEEYPETCSKEDLESYPLKKDCIEPSASSSNVNLPTKIDWDENAHWQKQGNCGYFACPAGADPNGSKSYKLSLELNPDLVSPPTSADSKDFSDYISKNFDQDTQEIEQGYFFKVLDIDNQPNYISKGTYRSSEYNFRVDHNPCWFKSGKDYNLTIQTCCGKDGTNCNSGETFNFTTAYAPELKSPEDLDWSGPNYSAWNAWPLINSLDKLPLKKDNYKPFDWSIQNPSSPEFFGLKVEPPALLDWCDVDSGELKDRETNSYSILPKIFETNPETEETKKVCAFNKGLTDELCYHISNPVTINFFSEYSDIENYSFTKNSVHSWQVRGCPTVMAGICTMRPYSQEWYFETSDTDLGSSTNIIPADGSIVGLPVSISWTNNAGYISSIFELYKGGALIEKKELTQSGITYNDLDLKATYSWKFKNCTDRYYQNCDDWSPLYKFTITGNAPELVSPSGTVVPPIDFKWKDVPGAKSYVFKVQGEGIDKEIKTRSNSIEIEYSDDFIFKMNSNYKWMVKTCADGEGLKCGDYSNSLEFVIKLDAPTNLEPENKTLSLYESRGSDLTWESVLGVETYEISFNYAKGEEEASKFCESLTQKENIVSANNYFFSPQCLGTYTWKVRSCFSDNCKEGTFSDWSDSKTFTIFQNINPETGEKVSESNNNTKSIVPCGRPLDDPETPWNERESCSISHFLIILNNIFDFALGMLVPLILAGSMVYSGIKFFTAMGNPNIIAEIKNLWKYIGIGILIILFSWTAVDFFLTFIGYNVGLFGLLIK